MWDNRPRRWALLAAALGALSPLRAEAADSTPAVRLDYRAATTCPERAAFVANVHDKATFVLAGASDAASRTFTVTLGANPSENSSQRGATAYRGVLQVGPRGSPRSSREVFGVDCVEVAEAIAVIIAIELGPDNRDEEEPTAPLHPPARSIDQPPRSVPTWRFGIAAGAGPTSALAEGVSVAARLPLVLRRGAATTWVSEFRAGPLIALGRTSETLGGSVTLRLFGAALEVCPLRAAITPRFSLEPCPVSVLALRAARGGPPSHPTVAKSNGFWADVGGSVRARLALSDSLWFDISVEGFLPLIRDRFHTFSPDIAVFEVPRAGVRASAVAGALF